MSSAATSLASRRRLRDRRADDERRASIDRMLHALYAATAEAFVGDPHAAPIPPTTVADALVDAGLPLERSLLDRLGRRADLHRMAVRLRGLQADEAAHAPDIVSIDPVERLASLPGRSPLAQAARALLAAEALTVDPYGDPTLLLSDLDPAEREALGWTVAGALAALGDESDARTIADRVAHVAAGAEDAPLSAAFALARIGEEQLAGSLPDIFGHGQVTLGIALFARGARLRWGAAVDLVLGAGDAVAALVSLTVREREPAARLLLALARALRPDEDRAAALAGGWVDLHDVLTTDRGTAHALLLPMAFTSARRRLAGDRRR